MESFNILVKDTVDDIYALPFQNMSRFKDESLPFQNKNGSPFVPFSYDLAVDARGNAKWLGDTRVARGV